ncbi:hypothetical protein P2P98_03100 [Microbacterium sp. Kw_RZR3]|nr:hypothetical protein [Microbacterium sp. Kw_RZR3]
MTADTLEEAAQFAIDRLKALAVTGGHRGFEMPELVSEFYLAGPWRRCFEFRGVFIPATT